MSEQKKTKITKRVSLASKLASRDATLDKGGLLTNCYREDVPRDIRIVKRPGFDLVQNPTECSGQGLVFFNGGPVLISCDTLQAGITAPLCALAYTDTIQYALHSDGFDQFGDMVYNASTNTLWLTHSDVVDFQTSDLVVVNPSDGSNIANVAAPQPPDDVTVGGGTTTVYDSVNQLVWFMQGFVDQHAPIYSYNANTRAFVAKAVVADAIPAASKFVPLGYVFNSDFSSVFIYADNHTACDYSNKTFAKFTNSGGTLTASYAVKLTYVTGYTFGDFSVCAASAYYPSSMIYGSDGMLYATSNTVTDLQQRFLIQINPVTLATVKIFEVPTSFAPPIVDPLDPTSGQGFISWIVNDPIRHRIVFSYSLGAIAGFDALHPIETNIPIMAYDTVTHIVSQLGTFPTQINFNQYGSYPVAYDSYRDVFWVQQLFQSVGGVAPFGALTSVDPNNFSIQHSFDVPDWDWSSRIIPRCEGVYATPSPESVIDTCMLIKVE